MASAELRAHRIPHQLHQFYTIHGRVAVRTAHVLVEMLADFRLLEVIDVRREINQGAGEHVLDDLFEPRISHAGHYAIRQTVIKIGQDVTGRPRSGGTSHRIGQGPEQVAPSQHFPHLCLYASKILCARSVNSLEQQPGDEIKLDRQPRATVKHEARKETRSREKVIDLLDVAISEDIFPRDK